MTTARAAAPRERQEWMDVFRGAAIVLVVLWHAPSIPMLLGYEVPAVVVTVNNALLPFRMPGLMFLSGLLLQRSLSKPMVDYYWGKARSIGWPYLIWGGLHMALYGLPWPWYHWQAWYGSGYLWFLFFILVYYSIAPLVRRVPPWLTVLVPLVVAAAMQPSKTQRIVYFAVFFFAGYAATCYPRLFRAVRGRAWLPLWCVLALVGATISAVRGVESAFHPLLAPFSIGGILVLVRVATWCQSMRWTGGLRRIGRNSIVYYTSHFPIILCVAYALRGTDLATGPIIAVLGFVAAMVGGAVLVRWRAMPPIRVLFDFPDLLGLYRRRAERART